MNGNSLSNGKKKKKNQVFILIYLIKFDIILIIKVIILQYMCVFTL
jgi:hypothetical protein